MRRPDLTRHFSLISLVFIVLTGIGLGWLMRDLALRQIKAVAEDRNIDTTLVFRNALWPQYADLVRASSGHLPRDVAATPAYDSLLANAKRLMKDSNFVKIKIYNLNGVTTFSTDRSQVGEDKRDNIGFLTARAGGTMSAMTYSSEFDSFEGTRHGVDLVFSYIPVRENGAVVGVFEVYQDVTVFRGRVLGALRDYVAWLAGGLFLLYLLQFLAVKRMDAALRAKDRELEDSNQALETHVVERTQDLTTRTAQLEDALADLAATRLRSMAGQESLSRLLRAPDFSGDDLTASLRMITRDVSATLDVARISLWRMSADGQAIDWINLAEAEGDSAQPEARSLRAADFPAYFKVLTEGEIIVADDARQHQATHEFARDYLEPLGIVAMLDVPVHVRGRLWGVVCHEHVGAPRQWNAEDVAFATAASALVALAIEGQERREVERRLRDLSGRMQQVLDTAPAGIYMVDKAHRIVFHSRQANAISGLPVEANWVGRPMRDFLRAVATMGAYGEGELETVIDARMREFLLAQPEATLVSDLPILHRTRYLRVTRTPHLDNGFVVIAVDATAEHKALDDLRQAKEAAEAANEAKSEFLSSMSHELRTPMNAILGFSQLMELDEALPEEHKDSLREILRAGQHLLGLINQVLDLAKIESGHVDLSIEGVAVDPLIDECVALIGSLALQRSIAISHNGMPRASVRADRTRLKQALLNLLSNAIKYNRDGGSVSIAVSAVDAERLRIQVTDTGRGMSPEQLKDLFQPFNRLSAENSDIEGTGIGLTITRRMVEVMGGLIDVSSEAGVGTSFWIDLPRDPDAVDADPDKVGAGTTAVAMAARRRVLYIEDNPANIRLVAQILGRRGAIHLLTAHTPELGLELARTRDPELILLDINMPGMDGYEVLATLKADQRLRHIPTVALTANVAPRDIERGIDAGFDDYLTKPLDVARFNAMIDIRLELAEAAT